MAKPERANRFRVIALCVIAATTFWFLNSLNENYSATVRFPLEFIYDPDKYIAVENLPADIQLNVNGLGWNLLRNNLGIKVTPIRIPLENPSEIKKISGAAVPGYIADQLNDFDLNFVITDTLAINIDRRMNKLCFVKIDSNSISLEENYRVTSPLNFLPDTTRISGPSSIIELLPDTVTVVIPQEEIDENYNEIVPITIEHPKTQLLKRNPPTVNITFDVEEFITSKVFAPLIPLNLPANADINIAALEVSYVVPSDQRDAVAAESFEILLDFEAMDPVDSTIIPELAMAPPYVQDVVLDTMKIKVIFNE